jgi:hypothetical protein
MKTFTKKCRKATMYVWQTTSGIWVGQLTGQEWVGTGHGMHLTTTDFILDNFDTVEEALTAVGYPVDLMGVPAELLEEENET